MGKVTYVVPEQTNKPVRYTNGKRGSMTWKEGDKQHQWFPEHSQQFGYPCWKLVLQRMLVTDEKKGMETDKPL